MPGLPGAVPYASGRPMPVRRKPGWPLLVSAPGIPIPGGSRSHGVGGQRGAVAPGGNRLNLRTGLGDVRPPWSPTPPARRGLVGLEALEVLARLRDAAPDGPASGGLEALQTARAGRGRRSREAYGFAPRPWEASAGSSPGPLPGCRSLPPGGTEPAALGSALDWRGYPGPPRRSRSRYPAPEVPYAPDLRGWRSWRLPRKPNAHAREASRAPAGRHAGQERCPPGPCTRGRGTRGKAAARRASAGGCLGPRMLAHCPGASPRCLAGRRPSGARTRQPPSPSE
jgi:hypothetical protein